LAPAQLRGASLGAYATSQFLGAGVGGVLGGVMLQRVGVSAVFAAAAVLTLLWLPVLLWGRSRVVAADAAIVA
jgi:predicted MFS family arabinose efflux permease